MATGANELAARSNPPAIAASLPVRMSVSRVILSSWFVGTTYCVAFLSRSAHVVGRARSSARNTVSHMTTWRLETWSPLHPNGYAQAREDCQQPHPERQRQRHLRTCLPRQDQERRQVDYWPGNQHRSGGTGCADAHEQEREGDFEERR